jgi:hypothetical protein
MLMVVSDFLQAPRRVTGDGVFICTDHLRPQLAHERPSKNAGERAVNLGSGHCLALGRSDPDLARE